MISVLRDGGELEVIDIVATSYSFLHSLLRFMNRKCNPLVSLFEILIL